MQLRRSRPSDPTSPVKRKRRDRAGDARESTPRIRRPRCRWQHDWRPHLGCQRCFAVFDTFVTHARRPDQACGNAWSITWCPRCHQPSPHEAWYADRTETPPFAASPGYSLGGSMNREELATLLDEKLGGLEQRLEQSVSIDEQESAAIDVSPDGRFAMAIRSSHAIDFGSVVLGPATWIGMLRMAVRPAD